MNDYRSSINKIKEQKNNKTRIFMLQSLLKSELSPTQKWQLHTLLGLAYADQAQKTEQVICFNKNIGLAIHYLSSFSHKKTFYIGTNDIVDYPISFQGEYLAQKVNICSVLLLDANYDTQFCNKVAFESMLTQVKCAEKYFQSCSKIFENSKNEQNKINSAETYLHKCFYYGGIAYFRLGNLSKAQKLLLKQKQFEQKNKLNEDLQKTLAVLSQLYIKMNDIIKSKNIVKKVPKLIDLHHEYIKYRNRFKKYQDRDEFREYQLQQYATEKEQAMSQYYEQLLQDYNPLIQNHRLKLSFIQSFPSPRSALFKYYEAECLMCLTMYSQAIAVIQSSLATDYLSLNNYERIEAQILRLVIWQREGSRDITQDCQRLYKITQKQANQQQIKHVFKLLERYKIIKRETHKIVVSQRQEQFLEKIKKKIKQNNVQTNEINYKNNKLKEQEIQEKQFNIQNYIKFCKQNNLIARNSIVKGNYSKKSTNDDYQKKNILPLINLPQKQFLYLVKHKYFAYLDLSNQPLTQNLLQNNIFSAFFYSKLSIDNVRSVPISLFPSTIKSLTLTRCRISDAKIFLSFILLQILLLSNNLIDNFPQYKTLTTLDLSANPITIIDCQCQQLVLKNNDMKKLYSNANINRKSKQFDENNNNLKKENYQNYNIKNLQTGIKYFLSLKKLDVSESKNVCEWLQFITQQLVEMEKQTKLIKITVRKIHLWECQSLMLIAQMSHSLEQIDVRGAFGVSIFGEKIRGVIKEQEQQSFDLQ